MKLVQFETSDGLRLNGLLATTKGRPRATIIHIHGKGGNFYENKFLRQMYALYPAMGYNILGFNNRGHSTFVEAYRAGRVDYVGASVESFDESLLDLAASVAFAQTFTDHVVLQGHSFGCEKIMHYALDRDPSVPLILLSPCDGYRLQNVYTHPETVEQQARRLQSTYTLTGMEWLPATEYGIRVPGAEYVVPITAGALYDLLTGPAFRLLRIDTMAHDSKLPNPMFAYLGMRDSLQVGGHEAMEDALRNRFPNGKVAVLDGGDHHLRPVTEQAIASIGSWLDSNGQLD